MDLNQICFDRPIQLVRADGAATADSRRGQRFAAAQIATHGRSAAA